MKSELQYLERRYLVCRKYKLGRIHTFRLFEGHQRRSCVPNSAANKSPKEYPRPHIQVMIELPLGLGHRAESHMYLSVSYLLNK